MDPEVLKFAMRVAALGTRDRGDPLTSWMMYREIDRLHVALTEWAGGEEPDLTFCCGCHEEIEMDQKQHVVDGAKYHTQCMPKTR
jgi:hypothetical protein